MVLHVGRDKVKPRARKWRLTKCQGYNELNPFLASTSINDVATHLQVRLSGSRAPSRCFLRRSLVDLNGMFVDDINFHKLRSCQEILF